MTSIAFLGTGNCLNLDGIGGTESIVRRLGMGLASQKHDVAFVRLGVESYSSGTDNHLIKQLDFGSLKSAFETLKQFEHIVTVYVPPRERIEFARFRFGQRGRRVFHFFRQNWPNSALKRTLNTFEHHLYPYNGKTFCVSPRLFKSSIRRGENSVFLLPPVPDNFFLQPVQKTGSDRPVISYIGRLDKKKGAGEAVDLFEHLSQAVPSIETRVYGYYWKTDTDGYRFHHKLLNQTQIKYIESRHSGYTDKVDPLIHQAYKETDILFLPYQSLSTTIDVPLVMLEGMAHLCAVVSTYISNLTDIYGSTQTFLKNMSTSAEVINTLNRLIPALQNEQERLYQHNSNLQYSTTHTIKKFLEAITED